MQLGDHLRRLVADAPCIELVVDVPQHEGSARRRRVLVHVLLEHHREALVDVAASLRAGLATVFAVEAWLAHGISSMAMTMRWMCLLRMSMIFRISFWMSAGNSPELATSS